MEKEELDLLKKFEKTNSRLADSNWKLASIRWSFLRGVIYGFGVFIGTALLTAAFIYILAKVQGWALIGDYARNILNIIQQNNK